MMFYMVVYYLMNIGAFLVVMIVANSTGREDIEGYRGLAWRGGAAPAVALAVFLFSLTGLPPLAGFIGKFYLFAAVIRQQFYFLAVVGVLNSVISLYYYARVVRTMFFDFPEGDEAPVTVGLHNGSLMWGLCAATLVLGVYWSPVIGLAERLRYNSSPAEVSLPRSPPGLSFTHKYPRSTLSKAPKGRDPSAQGNALG